MSEEAEKRQILLVEDDPDDVLLIREALAEHNINHDLDVVEDGDHALAYLRRQGSYRDRPRPDIVLLDLRLPRMDGLEVLKQIKADPQLREIPVVVLTTSTLPDDLLDVCDLSPSAYIVKPTEIYNFANVIKSIQQSGKRASPPRPQ